MLTILQLKEKGRSHSEVVDTGRKQFTEKEIGLVNKHKRISSVIDEMQIKLKLGKTVIVCL